MTPLTDAGSASVRLVTIAQIAFSDQRSLQERVLSGSYEGQSTWVSLSDPKTLSATVVF